MYDYLIAGAGAAGLSLAYHLHKNPKTREQKIAIIEKEEKIKNDRTWGFWSKQPGPFAEIIHQEWPSMYFHSPDYEAKISLAPYAYRMIRGLDFYNFTIDHIKSNPSFDWIKGEVLGAQETDKGVNVHINDRTIHTDLLFNTIPPPPVAKNPAYHYFLQHFKGLLIETEQAVFDPQALTFMDFQVPQEGEVRFVYILPFSPHRALVEFTIFSESLWPQEKYMPYLEEYIQEKLHVKQYQILEEEYGVIPMFDAPIQGKSSERIFNLGTRGGQSKASTGYTFMNIQKECHHLASQLAQGMDIPHLSPQSGRFKIYDQILLEVMREGRYPAWKVFRQMFKKHPVDRVFRFLDEKSSFWEELQIMHSVPSLPFVQAFFRNQYRKWFI